MAFHAPSTRSLAVLLAVAVIATLGCEDKGDSGATAPESPSRLKPGSGDSGGLPQARTVDATAVRATELPPISVVPPTIDFGFIPPNVDSFGSVKLLNTSDKPLTILAVQPTCKCTTLNDLAGTVIPPGSSVDLEAALDGGPNPGPKTAAVKILVGGFARPLEIALKAEISLPIRAIPRTSTPCATRIPRVGS